MRVLATASAPVKQAARPTAPVRRAKQALPPGAGVGLLAAATWGSLSLVMGSLHAADLTAGSSVFSQNCAACHSGGMNAIEADKTLEKEALTEYLDGGYNVDAIVKQVTNGKGSMPAWGKSLSPTQIQDVAAYVFNQADTDGW